MNFVVLATVIGSPLQYDADKGEWVVGTFYREDDTVEHAEGLYRSKLEHISSAAREPGHAPRYWELVGA